MHFPKLYFLDSCKLNCYTLSRNSKIFFQYRFGEHLNVNFDETRTKYNHALKKERAKIKAAGMNIFICLIHRGNCFSLYFSDSQHRANVISMREGFQT